MNTYYNFSPKLSMWYHEAKREKNYFRHFLSCLLKNPICQDFALYPKRFYKAIEQFDHNKTIDFCFIGGFKTDEKTQKNRSWILDFIKFNFNESSYLQFTDKITKKNYQNMGSFDYTLRNVGFVPKEHPVKIRNSFDDNYFRKMAASKFTLCPAGDNFWSMRFYEALMCKSIPIVKERNETFRSKAESELDYKFYFSNEQFVFNENWVEHNYKLFLKYHTLENR
ncbi:exostosin domain-containing protein [Desulforapulum autotrophicum]|nr:exostosin family protein [Desulforapulum autotrophicum]